MPKPSTTKKAAAERRQEKVLEQLASAARLCAAVERQLAGSGAPELETLIQLHRVMILKFSTEAKAAPELLKLVKDLMKPVMEWAQLEEKRKARELAEQQRRDQAEAEQATREREAKKATEDSVLKPETLEKIERELNLL